MPYFALIYDLIDDYVARRAPLRERHLALAEESRARGEIVLAGAFSDPVDKALLIFNASDKSIPESFVANDPYVNSGLVKHWEIRPWTVVVGNAGSS